VGRYCFDSTILKGEKECTMPYCVTLRWYASLDVTSLMLSPSVDW
jgi:hypothetical protein